MAYNQSINKSMWQLSVTIVELIGKHLTLRKKNMNAHFSAGMSRNTHLKNTMHFVKIRSQAALTCFLIVDYFPKQYIRVRSSLLSLSVIWLPPMVLMRISSSMQTLLHRQIAKYRALPAKFIDVHPCKYNFKMPQYEFQYTAWVWTRSLNYAFTVPLFKT